MYLHFIPSHAAVPVQKLFILAPTFIQSKQYVHPYMGHRNRAIFIQGLIAQKGLECLKALFSWKFENKSPEEEGEEEKN